MRLKEYFPFDVFQSTSFFKFILAKLALMIFLCDIRGTVSIERNRFIAKNQILSEYIFCLRSTRHLQLLIK